MQNLHTPASIVSDLFVTLAQNRLSLALLGDQTGFSGHRRSLAYRWFTDPAARAAYHPDDHDSLARGWVSSMRAVHGRADNDPEAQDLVQALLTDSPEFAALWERHEVTSRAGTRKRLVHAAVGHLNLDCQILTSENQTERLIVFTAWLPEDIRKLEQLNALSRQ